MTETTQVVFGTGEVLWWLPHALTGVSLLLVVVGLWWGRRSNLQVQAENRSNEYRLEIYRRLAPLVNEASTDIGKAMMWPQSFISEIRMNEVVASMGYQPSLSGRRGNEFRTVFFEADQLVTEVVLALEQNELVLPRFRIFRMALFVQSQRTRDKFGDLFPRLTTYLPTDVPEERQADLEGVQTLPGRDPDAEQLEELEALSEQFHKEVFDLQSYLHDLSIALQNTLLGPLFEGQVPSRRPKDSIHKVITTDPDSIRTLEKHLLEIDRFREHWAEHDLPSKYL